MKSSNQAIKVALYGMDTRASKMMTMYLSGPCKGIASVVGSSEAEIDIIDADDLNFKSLLQEIKSNAPERPSIVIALQAVSVEGAIYVKKPIESESLIQALKQIKANLGKKKRVVPPPVPVSGSKEIDKPDVKAEVVAEGQATDISLSKDLSAAKVDDVKILKQKTVSPNEKKKTLKHRTAIDLSDEVFSSYIGHVEGIDFSDKEQVLQASFNSKHYFLSYIQSALRVAKEKNRIIQLNANWKPLVIFPETHEIWLDTKDVQLRAFSGILMKQWAGSGSGVSLSAADPVKVGCNDKMESFYDADMLLWKVAIWTSKGRYPSAIDIHQPVYLKQWPNFTRLLITPNALQISAVLTSGPALMMDVVEQLKIKPEYMFVFISAAHALGIVGQEQQKANKIVTTAAKKPKARGLLAKILGKLRN